MNLLIELVALGVLAALIIYVSFLFFTTLRSSRLIAEVAQAEQRFFQTRVAEITAKSDYEREKNEFSWSGFRKFEVARKEPEGGGICSFYLRPHDNRNLPPFEPGQYLTFRLGIRTALRMNITASRLRQYRRRVTNLTCRLDCLRIISTTKFVKEPY